AVAGGDAGRGRPRGTVRPRPRPAHEGVAGGRRRGGGRVAAAGPGGASVRGPQARRVGAPVRWSGTVLITSGQPDTSRSRIARAFRGATVATVTGRAKSGSAGPRRRAS